MAGRPRTRAKREAAAASPAIADAAKSAGKPAKAPSADKKPKGGKKTSSSSPGVSSTPKDTEEHTTPPQKKMGRPSTFTQVVVDEICERIANGETLNAICKDPRLPARETVVRWAQSHERAEFGRAYARARDLQIQHWADEIIDLADDSSGDFVERVGKDGSVARVFDIESVHRSKLRLEARKWLLSKLKPGQYGEFSRSQVEVSGRDGGPIEVEARPKRPLLEIARRAVYVLQRAQDEAAAAGGKLIEGKVLEPENG